MNHILVKPHSYHTLDAWRGVASLWVVMFHMSQVIVASYPQLSANPIYIFSLSGSLGVQMFFVISGYCIANAVSKAHSREQRFTAFMRARIKRIFPPYLYALGLSGSLSVVASLLVVSHHLKSSVLADHSILHQSSIYYLTNLTLTQGIFHQSFLLPQAWTLCYEVAFYLAVGLFLATAYAFQGKIVVLYISHTVTCTLLVLLIAISQYVKYPFDLWPQFGLGILAYDLLSHPKSLKPKIWLIIAGALVVIFAALHRDNIGMMGEPSRPSYLFCLFFTVVIVLLHKYDEKMHKIIPIQLLSLIGILSYSLYLTHTFSIGVINQASKLLHLSVNLHPLLFILVIALSLGFACLFFRFCERPYVRSLKRPADLPQPLGTITFNDR